MTDIQLFEQLQGFETRMRAMTKMEHLSQHELEKIFRSSGRLGLFQHLIDGFKGQSAGSYAPYFFTAIREAKFILETQIAAATPWTELTITLPLGATGADITLTRQLSQKLVSFQIEDDTVNLFRSEIQASVGHAGPRSIKLLVQLNRGAYELYVNMRPEILSDSHPTYGFGVSPHRQDLRKRFSIAPYDKSTKVEVSGRLVTILPCESNLM